jgi:beta-xylosidase
MVHWRVISRVIPPSKGNWVTDRPSAGIWQGAITYFYGSFWIYFSAGGQWFSKATRQEGRGQIRLKCRKIQPLDL